VELSPGRSIVSTPVQDDRRVVVIGSGPPGATAALFLARAGIDVMLLEAGPRRSALGLTVRVRGLTVAHLARPLRRAADRAGISAVAADAGVSIYEDLAPGGLTNHWSCAVPRFSKDDFEDARRAGDAFAWPVGYGDLAPWYDQVEPLLRISGAAEDAPAVPAGRVQHAWALGRDWTPIGAEAARLGRSLLPLPYTYGSETTLTLSGTVFNSFARLVRPALRTGRLGLRFGARVSRLEWSPQKRRVTAVLYRDERTGLEERVPCGAVVVAAGAVNSARLLLESRSTDFPAGLGNTEGVLGRYLHDHPLGKLVVDLQRPISVHPPAYISRPLLDGTQPLYAAAAVQWTGTALRAKSLLAGHPGRMPWVGFNVFGTMAPSLTDGLRLDPARSGAAGRAGLTLEIRHPPEAPRVLEQTRDQIVEMLAGAGLAPRVRLWKIEAPGTSVHFGGTCRMHASPRFGMLDAWSRMHAVPNVVVADSAAFTTGPEKNPVLTAMALSARAADRLARDLRAGAFGDAS
jgi:choline dehydrogenase-like flavoprotein